MTIHIVIDIETVENEQAQSFYTEKKYYPKANLRDPVKIEQDIMVKRQKDLDNAPLYWWSNRIICLCANVLGADIKPKTFFGDNEAELLSQYFDFLCSLEISHPQEKVVIIGKNGDTFDKPVIIGRALRHDLGLPHVLRPYRPIDDIDQIFGFGSMASQRGKLNEYAMGLCIPAKIGHGSEVADMYTQVLMGNPDAWKQIYTYCAVDTDITSEILRRYLKEYKMRNPPVAEPTPPFTEDEIPFG